MKQNEPWYKIKQSYIDAGLRGGELLVYAFIASQPDKFDQYPLELIANRCGLNQVTASRIVRSLCEKGAIEIERTGGFNRYRINKLLNLDLTKSQIGISKKSKRNYQNAKSDLAKGQNGISKTLNPPYYISKIQDNIQDKIQEKKTEKKISGETSSLSKNKCPREYVEIFHQFYLDKKKTKYMWAGKDFVGLSGLIKKIESKAQETNSDTDTKTNLEAFLRKAYELDWYRDNFEPSILNSKFNNIYTEIRNGKRNNQSTTANGTSDDFLAEILRDLREGDDIVSTY